MNFDRRSATVGAFDDAGAAVVDVDDDDDEVEFDSATIEARIGRHSA